MSNAGLGDLCADDPEAYVQLAVALAGDVERRRSLRRGLRRELRDGPLGRTEAFARDVYGAIHRLVTARRATAPKA